MFRSIYQAKLEIDTCTRAEESEVPHDLENNDHDRTKQSTPTYVKLAQLFRIFLDMNFKLDRTTATPSQSPPTMNTKDPFIALLPTRA